MKKIDFQIYKKYEDFINNFGNEGNILLFEIAQQLFLSNNKLVDLNNQLLDELYREKKKRLKDVTYIYIERK